MLTDIAIKNAKPKDKEYKMSDAKGLYLAVTPSGNKVWRWKFRFNSKENKLSFGQWPEVGVKKAREKCEAARELLADGVNPSHYRKLMKIAQQNNAANTFEAITTEWLVKQESAWTTAYNKRVISAFERDIFPWLGQRPITEITPPELLRTITRIEDRGAIETAHRILTKCSQVFRYAIASGRLESDPARDLRGALSSKPATKHLAAVTEPEDVAKLLRMIYDYQGDIVVKSALRLAPMFFVRPGELRHARWEDINLHKAEWSFELSKRRPIIIHTVPLCRQAISILKELHPITCKSPFVFPNDRSIMRPMSDNAILAAMRSMSIPKETMSGHGFRAMARTMLDERLGYRPDIIEHQIGHKVKDPHGRAYNRTKFLEVRCEMMQAWADYLDNLRQNG